MNKNIFKNMEWWILIAAILLCVVGFVALYSATKEDGLGYFRKQLMWFGASIVIMIIFALINYEILVKISPFIYGISIILLIAVLFTRSINGASSWFNIGSFSLQPGEISKISVILFLTFVITKVQLGRKEEINRISQLLIVFGAFALPVGLIVLQPDFGTAAAYLVTFAMMLFVAGLDKKYLIVALLLIVIGVPLAYKFVLPDHVKARIDVFLNPESDPRGAGYNIIQSKLAVGAGELTGMGILNGNQTQLGYLSPKTTDFIFALIGEEMGFVVAGTLIVVYTFLITKALFIAKTAKDDEGAYIAAGISGMLLFHMTENIGMTMGLLPITGVPLMFVSYGGSAMITSFICIGLLLNISGQRKRTIFVK